MTSFGGGRRRRAPIQVKQMDKVGRPDIDQFAAAMDRERGQRGFFVAFDSLQLVSS